MQEHPGASAHLSLGLESLGTSIVPRECGYGSRRECKRTVNVDLVRLGKGASAFAAMKSADTESTDGIAVGRGGVSLWVWEFCMHGSDGVEARAECGTCSAACSAARSGGRPLEAILGGMQSTEDTRRATGMQRVYPPGWGGYSTKLNSKRGDTQRAERYGTSGAMCEGVSEVLKVPRPGGFEKGSERRTELDAERRASVGI